MSKTWPGPRFGQMSKRMSRHPRSGQLASREAVYLRDLLDDIGHGASAPTPMWLDSKAAIDLTADPIAFKKTKHIMRHAYELRDRISRRLFAVGFVPSRPTRRRAHQGLTPSRPRTTRPPYLANLQTYYACQGVSRTLAHTKDLLAHHHFPPHAHATLHDARCTPLTPVVSHRRTWTLYLPNCRPPCSPHGSYRPRPPGPTICHQPPCPCPCAQQQCPGMHVPPTLRRRHLQPADATRDAWPRQLW